MQYTPYVMKGTRLASYHIRGTKGTTALVRVWIDEKMSADARHALASQEAREQGCMPDGTVLVYEVVPQDEMFYNKLFTLDEVKAIKNNPELMALVR